MLFRVFIDAICKCIYSAKSVSSLGEAKDGAVKNSGVFNPPVTTNPNKDL
jgi:hypothetical protein